MSTELYVDSEREMGKKCGARKKAFKWFVFMLVTTSSALTLFVFEQNATENEVTCNREKKKNNEIHIEVLIVFSIWVRAKANSCQKWFK